MYSVSQIESMSYVDFMALINEVNRPPGGNDSIRLLIQNTFLTEESKVLDVGCNTGYCTFQVAQIAHCYVTGLDISENMISASQHFLREYYPQLHNRVKFTVGDGQNLPFPNSYFDLVMSGGSTVFIPNIQTALHEYTRVVKPWGFIADINFYYHTPPPKTLISKLNNTMGINIQPWDLEYWMDIYSETGLQMYYQYSGQMESVTNEELENYCSTLAQQQQWSNEVLEAITLRLTDLMKLFNENHRYLGYGIFILRKSPIGQPELF